MEVAEEIERAVDGVKRTRWDKEFRRAWYRAEALRRKGEGGGKGRGRYKRKQSITRRPVTHRGGSDSSRAPSSLAFVRRRIWVRGHVPRRFLDWFEQQQQSDWQEREMLERCFFEELRR